MEHLKNVTTKNIKMVASVQCAIALERCSGFHCAWAFGKKKNHFSKYSQDIMHISLSCGGCPGRRLSRLLSNLVKCAKKKEGWEKSNIMVHLAACVVNDNGHYPRCPFTDYMKAIICQKGFEVSEGGYESCTAQDRREKKQYKAYDFLRGRRNCFGAEDENDKKT